MFLQEHAQPVPPSELKSSFPSMWACMLLRLSPSPNSYPNELRMLQGLDMTNASFKSATANGFDFVGVGMAKDSFVWSLHGVPGTHTASNQAGGSSLCPASRCRNCRAWLRGALNF